MINACTLRKKHYQNQTKINSAQQLENSNCVCCRQEIFLLEIENKKNAFVCMEGCATDVDTLTLERSSDRPTCGSYFARSKRLILIAATEFISL